MQNAAIAEHGQPSKNTIDINFWGTANMMKEFYPLINKNGRIGREFNLFGKFSKLHFCSENVFGLNLFLMKFFLKPNFPNKNAVSKNFKKSNEILSSKCLVNVITTDI